MSYIFEDIREKWLMTASTNDDRAILCRQLDKDLNKVFKRLDAEGLPFITDVLPKYAVCILTGLELGQYVIKPGFSPASKGDTRPKFLWVLCQHLFDCHGKPVLNDLSPLALQSIMQICKCFSKAMFVDTIPVTQKIRKNLDWRNIEIELKSQRIWDDDPILHYAQHYIARIFARIPSPKSIRPKHGPGAVSEIGCTKMGKWKFQKYTGLNLIFPFHEYFQNPEACTLRSLVPPDEATKANEIADCRMVERKFQYKVDFDSVGEFPHGVSRMSYVPKTALGPRIIGMEPKEMMYIQQGLKGLLYKELEQNPLTKGFVNFTEQGINQSLALQNSITRDMGTIDLSSASDRVSWKLVQCLFKLVPDWLQALRACRSTHMETRQQAKSVVEEGPHKLQKFAGMGSALTFPIEGLVFYALARGVQYYTQGNNNTPIYVYGDDIVIPTSLYDNLRFVYARYNLLINADKSYVQSHFRESCGVEAYNGVEVTPIKIRRFPFIIEGHKPPLVQEHFKAMLSCNATAWLLFKSGYTRASRYLSDLVRSSLPRKFRACYCESDSYDVGACLVSPPFELSNVQSAFADEYAALLAGIYRNDNLCNLNRQIDRPVRAISIAKKGDTVVPQFNNSVDESAWLVSGLIGTTPEVTAHVPERSEKSKMTEHFKRMMRDAMRPKIQTILPYEAFVSRTIDRCSNSAFQQIRRFGQASCSLTSPNMGCFVPPKVYAMNSGPTSIPDSYWN